MTGSSKLQSIKMSRRSACDRMTPWVATAIGVSLWILVAVLLVNFVRHAALGATSRTHGFIAYYTLARLVAEGTNIAPSYNYSPWFQSQMDRFQPGISDVNYNPPTTALLLLPFSDLEYEQARVAWTLLGVIALVVAGGWLLGALHLGGWYTPALVGLVLMYEPLLANFRLGQAYVLMFALLVTAWAAYHYERESLLGIVIGLLFVFKLVGLFLWLLLAVQGRWRTIALGIATVLLLLLGSLPWIGLSAWQAYIPFMISVASEPGRAVTAYQDVSGFFSHLLTFDALWNSTPLVNLPGLSAWLSWLTFGVMVAVSVYWARRLRGAQADLIFGAFVVLGVVLGPLALDYHYALLLVPIGILVARLKRQASVWHWVFLALASVLIAADLPYRSPGLAVGALALLAYPKLYGACLLWGLSLWLLRFDVEGSQISFIGEDR